MSIYVQETPRGGNPGIMPTDQEMMDLQDTLKTEYMDQYIPIPNVPKLEQVYSRILTPCCTADKYPDKVIYWERSKGAHGWCCANCGYVVQWG